MNAFIIMKNRITWPKAMCEFLADTGCTPILIDNDSDYPPLLEWYKNCPYKVHRLKENLGHLALWKSGIIDEYQDRFYILTDPDLDISSVPHDYVDVLMKGFENKTIVKSGLSLEISDLPNNPYAKEAYAWELKFWDYKRKKNGYYESSIDTTFALYDKERTWGEFPGGEPSNNRFFDAVRSPRPYTAKHLPWYLTPDNMTAEEKYYHERTDKYWSGKYKEIWQK